MVRSYLRARYLLTIPLSSPPKSRSSNRNKDFTSPVFLSVGLCKQKIETNSIDFEIQLGWTLFKGLTKE